MEKTLNFAEVWFRRKYALGYRILDGDRELDFSEYMTFSLEKSEENSGKIPDIPMVWLGEGIERAKRMGLL